MARRKQPIKKTKKPTNAKGAEQGVKKPHRYKPGTVALRQIRKYQKTTDLLIQRAPFQRKIRSVATGFNENIRFQESALLALQEGLEAHLTALLENSNLLSIFAKRQTIMGRDITTVRELFKSRDRLIRRE